ncbi:hypothetical protein FQN50_008088 [Emmonsiellopsis sp. PD_5]|nr:hypothetical protein FQN50_008088 [Emmonsiellopsis sp. PD_5]
MAAPPQLPRHVSAHLSNLTSRPGVQSTLLLSRKDGSIIQSSGLLASRSSPASTPPAPASIPEPAAPEQQSDPNATANETTEPSQPPAPYKPTQAETLAAHIFAFVSSASALSTSLSNPSSVPNNETDYGSGTVGADNVNGHGHARNDSGESEGYEREEDDDVKLLRLRTKIHEIIIIPDRKFLLCVVHDLSGATGSTGGGGGGGGGFGK